MHSEKAYTESITQELALASSKTSRVIPIWRQDAEHGDALHLHGGPSAAQLAVGAAQQHHNQQDGGPADGCRVGKPGTTTGVDNHDPDQKKR